MGSKLQDLKTLNVPGAGNYEPSLTFTKQAGPNYSMGIKLKSDLVKSTEVPGPGQYSNNSQLLKTAAPKFGFGSSKRPDITGNKM